jgi:hypothetical protein
MYRLVAEVGRCTLNPQAQAWMVVSLASAFRRGTTEMAPDVRQSVSGRVRGSPKRVMTLVLKPVMAVTWSPAVVMTRRAWAR